MDPRLEYAGEALVLIGIAVRLLRWAFDAVREGDAPPSATFTGNAPPRGALATMATLLGGNPVRVVTKISSNKFNVPMTPGSTPELPPELAAQLTPELRAKVLEAMTKVQPGGPLHFTASTTFNTHLGLTHPVETSLFPPEMLAAMTPEQRAKVMETVKKQLDGAA